MHMGKGAGSGKEGDGFSLGHAVESKVPVGLPGGDASREAEFQNWTIIDRTKLLASGCLPSVWY